MMHLPVIKQLFSSNDNSVQQSDVVMLLTPRIVRTREFSATRSGADLHRHAVEPRSERPAAAHRSAVAGSPGRARPRRRGTGTWPDWTAGYAEPDGRDGTGSTRTAGAGQALPQHLRRPTSFRTGRMRLRRCGGPWADIRLGGSSRHVGSRARVPVGRWSVPRAGLDHWARLSCRASR